MALQKDEWKIVTITWKGIEETKRFLAEASEAVQDAVKKALKETATLTKEEAKRNCPVDTGFLRSSIYYRVADYSYTVGASASYGGYVEFGTRYMMAQPYLRPAFIFVTRTIPSAMSKEILKELEAI